MRGRKTVWQVPENAHLIASPGLLIDPDRVADNIQVMLKMVGGDADRLRPHVKTYKIAEIVKAQMTRGIHKFKCATIAEVPNGRQGKKAKRRPCVGE